MDLLSTPSPTVKTMLAFGVSQALSFYIICEYPISSVDLLLENVYISFKKDITKILTVSQCK